MVADHDVRRPSASALSHGIGIADADGEATRPPMPIAAAANVVIANILSLFMISSGST